LFNALRWMLEHKDVPKSHHAKAFLLQEFCPAIVVPKLLLIVMLTSVEFDNEARGKAGKIDNERSDRMLTAEL